MAITMMFFEFLQIAIGVSGRLSRILDEQGWMALLDFCKKQSLIGVGSLL